jgi:chromosome segregation ATPase
MNCQLILQQIQEGARIEEELEKVDAEIRVLKESLEILQAKRASLTGQYAPVQEIVSKLSSKTTTVVVPEYAKKYRASPDEVSNCRRNILELLTKAGDQGLYAASILHTLNTKYQDCTISGAIKFLRDNKKIYCMPPRGPNVKYFKEVE